MMTWAPLSPEVQRFAEAMQHELDENAHKGTWKGVAVSFLLTRLDDEVAELRQAVRSGSQAEVLSEAADVGNFCLMIADVFGCFGEIDGARDHEQNLPKEMP